MHIQATISEKIVYAAVRDGRDRNWKGIKEWETRDGFNTLYAFVRVSKNKNKNYNKLFQLIKLEFFYKWRSSYINPQL